MKVIPDTTIPNSLNVLPHILRMTQRKSKVVKNAIHCSAALSNNFVSYGFIVSLIGLSFGCFLKYKFNSMVNAELKSEYEILNIKKIRRSYNLYILFIFEPST